jgi:hypothetical protein
MTHHSGIERSGDVQIIDLRTSNFGDGHWVQKKQETAF